MARAQVYDPPELGQVPLLTAIRTEVKGGMLRLTARLSDRDPNPFYSASQPGGWSLQFFLDTDQRPTGYWHGYEYLVDGADREGEGPVPILGPIPDCCDWGPVTGLAGLDLTRTHRLLVTVPLDDVGGDDGAMHWALTLYATVPCAECPGGVLASYAETWFGTSYGDGSVWRIARRGYDKSRLSPTLYSGRTQQRAVELPWPRPLEAAAAR